MKKNYKAVVAAMMAMSLFASCSSDDDQTPVVYVDPSQSVTLANGASLSGTMATNIVLAEGCTYTLSGAYYVPDGLTLTIQPGVTIESNYVPTNAPTVESSADFRYILVQQGGKIEAKGTAAKPIVMTVADKNAQVHGAWGGVHICGKAPINSGTTAQSEIGNFTYGGTVSNDNSGSLEYVILMYTGQELDDESEANGVSFYGVGSGTTINHVHAFKGSDDGFEFFGGTVNVSNLMVTDCQDDSIDWTEGWVGNAQFLYVTQEASNCDCLFECDNNSKNETATPISCPTIANATLQGADNGSKTRGINLKVGSEIKLYNSIVYGKKNAVDVTGTVSNAALVDGKSIMSGVALVAASDDAAIVYVAKNDVATPTTFYKASKFLEGSNNQIVLDVTSVDSAKSVATPAGFVTANYLGAYEGTLANSWVATLSAASYIK